MTLVVGGKQTHLLNAFNLLSVSLIDLSNLQFSKCFEYPFAVTKFFPQYLHLTIFNPLIYSIPTSFTFIIKVNIAFILSNHCFFALITFHFLDTPNFSRIYLGVCHFKFYVSYNVQNTTHLYSLLLILLIMAWTKEYTREYFKEYYKKNKDKIREQNKEYYLENVEKIREQKREYQKKNKNKIKEQRKASTKKYEERNKAVSYTHLTLPTTPYV